MTQDTNAAPDPRPTSVKVLCFLAVIMGALSLRAPFDLIPLQRASATEPSVQMIRSDPVIFPYLVGSAIFTMIVGLAQAFFGMAALSLKNWGRLGLIATSALLIIAFCGGMYINLTYIPGAMEKHGVTRPVQSYGSFSSVISLLWLIPPVLMLFVFNRPDVRHLFLIAKALKQ